MDNPDEAEGHMQKLSSFGRVKINKKNGLKSHLRYYCRRPFNFHLQTLAIQSTLSDHPQCTRKWSLTGMGGGRLRENQQNKPKTNRLTNDIKLLPH